MADQVRFGVAIERDVATGRAQGFQVLGLRQHGVEATVTPGGEPLEQPPDIGK